MTPETWMLFVVVWFAAGLPLGPNAANCIAVAAAQGFGRALWAVAGILLAGLGYMAAVVLGLGAVLLANEALFTVLKLAGAAYLIWMGLRLILSRAARPDAAPAPALSRAGTVRKAVLVSLSNPKAMISYGAVFSQFISPDGALGVQLLVIVPTALVVTAVVYTGYCALGTGVRRVLGTARRMAWFNRGNGGFYVFAGGALAVSELGGRR